MIYLYLTSLREMGVKHLMKEINARASDAIVKGDLSDYSGKRIAIDVSGVFHKYKEFMPVSGFLKLIELFRDNEIQTIWVFDGSPLEHKHNTLEKRKAQRKKQEEKNPDKIHKVTNDYVNYVIHVLLKYGMKVIFAKYESDPVLARLYKNGTVDAVISGDSDMLAYGVGVLITEYNTQGKITVVLLDAVLRDFGVTQEFFTDLCIIWGTDYADNPPGYGKIKGEKLMEVMGKLENVKHVITADLYKSYMEIKKIFTEPPMDVIDMPELGPLPELGKFVHKGSLEKEKNMISKIEKRLSYL